MVKKIIFIFPLILAFFVVPLAQAQGPIGTIPRITVLFSPQDNCAQEIVSQIDKAQNSVDVAMYLFTSRPIAQALVRAKARGVGVKVCLAGGHEPAYERFSKSEYLIKNGILVKLIEGSGIMHNKFCIIDDFTTISGSYNWTARADLENDENVLIIKSKKIAKIYKEQFKKFWDGTYTDSCMYKDKDRLEKTPVPKGAVLPIPKSSYKGKYVGSKNSNRFHRPDCKWAKRIKPANRVWFDTRQQALKAGYVPCKVCKP